MGATQSKPPSTKPKAKPRRSTTSTKTGERTRTSSNDDWQHSHKLQKSVSQVLEDDSQSLSRSLSPSENGWDDSDRGEYDDGYGKGRSRGIRTSGGITGISGSETASRSSSSKRESRSSGTVSKGIKEVKVIKTFGTAWQDDESNQTGESRYERQIIDQYYYTPKREKPKWRVEMEQVEELKRESQKSSSKRRSGGKGKGEGGRRSGGFFRRAKDAQAEVGVVVGDNGEGKVKNKHPVQVGIEVCKRMGVFTVAKKDLDTLPEEMLEKLPGTVTVMDLSHNRLVIIPAELCKYVLTARFSAAFNRLSAVPPYFGKMTGLRKIDLSHNQIEYLPDELFRNMRELEELDLSDNQLTTLPSSLFTLPKLLHLNLARNRLTTVPKEIESMKWLMILDVSSNVIKNVPESMGKNTQLRKLILHDNEIQKIPAEILTSCAELRMINVKQNPVKLSDLKHTNGFDTYVERCLCSRPKYLPRDAPDVLQEYVLADP